MMNVDKLKIKRDKGKIKAIKRQIMLKVIEKRKNKSEEMEQEWIHNNKNTDM